MMSRAAYATLLSAALLLGACESDTLESVPPESVAPRSLPRPARSPSPTPAPTDPMPAPTDPDLGPDPEVVTESVVDRCDPRWHEVSSFESLDVSGSGGHANVPTGTDLGGFLVEGPDVDVMRAPHWEMACGAQAIDLSGWRASQIGTTLTTVPGARYRLRYLVATNPDYGTGPIQPKTLEVYWGGVLVDVLHPDPAGRSFRDMRWELRTLDLTARAAVTTLQLRSLDDSNSGPAIDRVTLDRR